MEEPAMKNLALITLLAFGVVAVSAPAQPVSAQRAGEKPITEEGQKLLDDMARVYKKWSEIVLKKIKDNTEYKSSEVWDQAVKEAQNAKYKNSKEFFDAVAAMQNNDATFKKKSTELVNKATADHQKAVKEWADGAK
jgi:hypothetical protein